MKTGGAVALRDLQKDPPLNITNLLDHPLGSLNNTHSYKSKKVIEMFLFLIKRGM